MYLKYLRLLISICDFQGTFLGLGLIPSGDGEIRTLDPLLARQVLSQLSYTPMDAGLPSFEAIPYSFMFCIYFNQPVTPWESEMPEASDPSESREPSKAGLITGVKS